MPGRFNIFIFLLHYRRFVRKRSACRLICWASEWASKQFSRDDKGEAVYLIVVRLKVNWLVIVCESAVNIQPTDRVAIVRKQRLNTFTEKNDGYQKITAVKTRSEIVWENPRKVGFWTSFGTLAKFTRILHQSLKSESVWVNIECINSMYILTCPILSEDKRNNFVSISSCLVHTVSWEKIW